YDAPLHKALAETAPRSTSRVSQSDNYIRSQYLKDKALFGYENQTNNLKLIDTGTSGLQGLVNEFNCSSIQYAFCQVIDDEAGINKIVLLHWQGESAPLTRKGLCASHIPDVARFFKVCHQTITLRNDDEATPQYIMEQIARSSSSRVSLKERSIVPENVEPVGTNYKPLKVSQEIGTIDRKKFWQAEEEAEKQRLLEEKRRASEKQAQFEAERKRHEAVETQKLQQAISEREKSIEATRQADANSDRQSSSGGSQQNSILSSGSTDHVDNCDDDDERVGRRSELLRRERNQETSSLIAKGIIKNARAIFEQQAASSDQTQYSTLTKYERKQPSNNSSGSLVSGRIQAMRSLNTASATKDNNKLNQNNNQQAKTTATPILSKAPPNVSSVKSDNGISPSTKFTASPPMNNLPKDVSAKYEEEQLSSTMRSTHLVADEATNDVPLIKPPAGYDNHDPQNGSTPIDMTTNLNGKVNGDHNAEEKPISSPVKPKTIDLSSEHNNGNIVSNNVSLTHVPETKFNEATSKLSARALYDYQATDDTEINFDPGDIIDDIDQVDPGWWQGTVVTGKFKGQVGLFPANYVELLHEHNHHSSNNTIYSNNASVNE
ncbi:Drebrin-like protein, partial [Fragariocoptes setiger]